MALFETVAFTIGASIGKAVIKSCVKDGVAADFLPDVVDLLKELGLDAKSRRSAEDKLGEIGTQVAARVRVLLDQDRARIDEGTVNSVVLEAAATLGRTRISAELLIQLNLDPEQLRRHLLDARPEATREFAADETALHLYQRMLLEASRAIMEIAAELSGFTRFAFADALQGQDRILAYLAKLAALPDTKAVEFERKYRQAVRERLDRMDLLGVRRADTVQRQQSLTISYVALQLEHYREGAGATAGSGTPLRAAKRESAKPSGAIDPMLALSRRIVVRGDAGSGKTTLLQWAAVRAASPDEAPSAAEWGRVVPFFIRLRSFVNEGFPAPEAFVRQLVSVVADTMPAGWVHDQLERGRALVLVDGVDELPRDKRGLMLERLAELVSLYPFARYIVSSRPAALKADLWPEWQQWITREGFTELALQPMGPDQVAEFIDHWHQAVQAVISDAEEQRALASAPAKLKRELGLTPALRRLATSPLLCAVICALHREMGRRLPAERIDLYRECSEMLLHEREDIRWDSLSRDYPALSKSQKLALIQDFACWLLRSGSSDVEVAEADQHFSQRLTWLNLPEVTGTQVREYFVERTNMLREPVLGRIDFRHRTFQEFLGAHAAVEEAAFSELVRNATDDQWRETIVLAAGLARPMECAKLLKDLIKRGNQAKRRQRQLHLLAVACLETAVQVPPDVRSYVLQEAGHLFPPKDFEEAKVIAAAGDPAISFLVPRPEYPDAVAAACVRALALIGTNEALTALESYGSSTSPDVIEELGRRWDSFDRQEYARRVLTRNDTLHVPSLNLEGLDQLPNIRTLIIGEPPTQWEAWYSRVATSLQNTSTRTPATLLMKRPSAIVARGWNSPEAAGEQSLVQAFLSEPLIAATTVVLTAISSIVVHRLEPAGITDDELRRGLAMLPNLRVLEVNVTVRGDHLELLASAPGLRKLGLRGIFGEVTDVRGLSACRELETLVLYGFTKLTDLGPLAQLANLQGLELVFSAMSDLRPLTGLTSLKALRLSFCPSVEDLTPLGALKNLTRLDLTGCAMVNDVRPLAQLPALAELALAGTRVTDLSPLSGKSQLKITQ
jgi:hypothetical protein